ncbi:MAG: four helix bundle protein [Bacteroidales bacterium]|nr:four helix bundle protein [Bacteroidales bacterium]
MEDFGKFLRIKCMDFSIDVVNLYRHLTEDVKEYVLSKQILRSGTSIGANLVEAQNAVSDKEFLSKIFISLKETAETEYWLELLYKTNLITKQEYDQIMTNCKELYRLFNSITQTTKNKLKPKNQ